MHAVQSDKVNAVPSYATCSLSIILLQPLPISSNNLTHTTRAPPEDSPDKITLEEHPFCQTGPNAWRYTTPTIPIPLVQPMFIHQLSAVVASLRVACHSPARIFV